MDCILRNKLEVLFCPTDDMWADFLTKALQGKKFARFRQILMNHGNSTLIEEIADREEGKINSEERKISPDATLKKVRESRNMKTRAQKSISTPIKKNKLIRQ